jgi:hypothetical protein
MCVKQINNRFGGRKTRSTKTKHSLQFHFSQTHDCLTSASGDLAGDAIQISTTGAGDATSALRVDLDDLEHLQLLQRVSNDGARSAHKVSRSLTHLLGTTKDACE